MSNKQHPIHRIGENKSDPTFEAHRLKSALGWYVRVSWRYGQVEHVSGFASGQAAQKWIEEKSKTWLRGRTGARSGA
jgi:hypothetical protein